MNDTIEVDLREWGKALLYRIWIIILCAVICGTAVLIYTANFIPAKYKAEVTMFLNNKTAGEDYYMNSSDYAVALRQVETYTKIISSNAVLDKVAESLGGGITGDQIRGMMAATAVGETEMFKVTVLSTDPELSKNIANAIADVAPGEIAKFGLGSVAKVVDYARAPKSRYSPSYTVNTVLGAMAGAIAAAAVIILQLQLDVRVKKSEDLEKILSVPVLGVIPELSETNKRPAVGKVRR